MLSIEFKKYSEICELEMIPALIHLVIIARELTSSSDLNHSRHFFLLSFFFFFAFLFFAFFFVALLFIFRFFEVLETFIVRG